MLKYQVQFEGEWEGSYTSSELHNLYLKKKITQETWLCDETQTVFQYKHLIIQPDQHELLRFKAFWDNIEKSLKDLRDQLKIDGRISQKHKADILAKIIESGEDYDKTYSLLYQYYPEYCAKQEEEKVPQKGCIQQALTVLKVLAIIGILIAIVFMIVSFL